MRNDRRAATTVLRPTTGAPRASPGAVNGARREFLAATALWLAAASISAGAEELPVFELTARDGRFRPESIEVPAGRRFKIVIRNDGPGAIEFEMLSPFKERVLGPGGRSFLVFAPLKPGQYEFFDEFHPDTGKGRIIAR